MVESDDLLITMEDAPNCPACGAAGAAWKTGEDGVIHASRCPACEMAWHNPRLTRAALDDYYRTGYYRRTVPADQRFELRRGQFLTGLIDAFGISPRRVLDVGCAHGFLLRELQEQFDCQVVGLELYPPLLAAVDDIRTTREAVDGLFDLICYIHSLEHVYDPHEELDWALSHLAPSGALLIELPLDEHRLQLPHPLMFSEQAIQALMERHGLVYMNIDMRQVKRNKCDLLAMRKGEALDVIGKPVVVTNAVKQPEYCG